MTTNTNTNTSVSKPSTAKYRPVLTSSQLEHIIAMLKIGESPLSDTGIATIHYLTGFLYKIQHAGSIPAYTSAGKKKRVDMLEALGGIESIASDLSISKEEQWAASYAIYVLKPSDCTVSQIQEAHEHMYLNDLMTEEQILDFEAKATSKREAI